MRDRILSEAEIRVAWKLEGDLSDLIKLCLLTAQRSGEVCGMQGEELNLKARNWIIPSSRTKIRRCTPSHFRTPPWKSSDRD